MNAVGLETSLTSKGLRQVTLTHLIQVHSLETSLTSKGLRLLSDFWALDVALAAPPYLQRD